MKNSRIITAVTVRLPSAKGNFPNTPGRENLRDEAILRRKFTCSFPVFFQSANQKWVGDTLVLAYESFPFVFVRYILPECAK